MRRSPIWILTIAGLMAVGVLFASLGRLMRSSREPVKAQGRLSLQLVGKGREVYEKAGCGECHGRTGRGDGPSAGQLKDEWGNPIRPADLTRRPFKGGSTPRDLFRTLITGLGGTPMPSYRDALTDEELWALVYYVDSLAPRGVREDVVAGEEARGAMVERMHRMMGPGMMGPRMMDRMMRRMPMMPGMPMR